MKITYFKVFIIINNANQELINIKKEAAASLPNTWTYKPVEK
ncbi:hypothetical protein OKW21_004104 [Catalinimonas alkaloidigena]|nr:hypothetical protein [Catalinimonas alkaloidigena]